MFRCQAVVLEPLADAGLVAVLLALEHLLSEYFELELLLVLRGEREAVLAREVGAVQAVQLAGRRLARGGAWRP